MSVCRAISQRRGPRGAGTMGPVTAERRPCGPPTKPRAQRNVWRGASAFIDEDHRHRGRGDRHLATTSDGRGHVLSGTLCCHYEETRSDVSFKRFKFVALLGISMLIGYVQVPPRNDCIQSKRKSKQDTTSADEWLPSVQEMRIFIFKKHVKFGRMIRRALFKVCSIACYTFFPIFRAICQYHGSNNLPLSLRTVHRAIFSHLRTNQSAAQ